MNMFCVWAGCADTSRLYVVTYGGKSCTRTPHTCTYTHTITHTHTHIHERTHSYMRHVEFVNCVGECVSVCVCVYCVHLGAHIHQRTHSYTRHEGFGDGQSADEMAQWKRKAPPRWLKPLSAGCNLRTSRRGCRERLWRLLGSEPYGGAGRTTPNRGLQKTNTGWRGCIGCLIYTGDFPQKRPMIGDFLRKEMCNLRHPLHLRHPVAMQRLHGERVRVIPHMQ